MIIGPDGTVYDQIAEASEPAAWGAVGYLAAALHQRGTPTTTVERDPAVDIGGRYGFTVTVVGRDPASVLMPGSAPEDTACGGPDGADRVYVDGERCEWNWAVSVLAGHTTHRDGAGPCPYCPFEGEPVCHGGYLRPIVDALHRFGVHAWAYQRGVTTTDLDTDRWIEITTEANPPLDPYWQPGDPLVLALQTHHSDDLDPLARHVYTCVHRLAADAASYLTTGHLHRPGDQHGPPRPDRPRPMRTGA